MYTMDVLSEINNLILSQRRRQTLYYLGIDARSIGCLLHRYRIVFIHTCKLHNEFGIEEDALNWFRSCYKWDIGRVTQFTQFKSVESHRALCWVHECVRCTLVSFHTSYRHRWQHRYEDDTKIYIQFEENNKARSEAIAKLENCISDTCLWMKANASKLNEAKTECIIFSLSKDPVHMTLVARTRYCQDTKCLVGQKNYIGSENLQYKYEEN